MIGRDIPDVRAKVVVVESNLVTRVTGPAVGQADTVGTPEQQPIFNTAREQEAAKVTLRVLKEFERLPRSTDLQQPEIQRQIIQKVTAELQPVQGELIGVAEQGEHRGSRGEDH